MAETQRPKPRRVFKGVWIPREIYLAKDLSWTEKILLIEIDSLDGDEDKGCWASNRHLADFLGVSPGTAANLVSGLKKKGYVVELWTDGKHRGLATVLRKNMLHEKMKDMLHDFVNRVIKI
ncbi:MAG: helix-turn-helix domain-containing protein [Pyrinomonadaceae bacterium]